MRFKYKEIIANHYRYRGAVDEHNAERHDEGSGARLSLESSSAAIRWEYRMFALLLTLMIFLNIWMYVVHHLEDAVEACRNKDLDKTTESLDFAAAYYIGADQTDASNQTG